MTKHEDYITLGQLIDAGAVEITLGFPCGSHNCDGEGIPHIRPFNIQPNGKISLEQIKSIPLDLASRKPTLRQGDIVFNNTNTKELVGKCAVWEGNQEFVFSNHMTRIRLHDKQIDNEYLNFAILHHWFTGKSEMLARSHVAQASIIGERFREILLPWRSTNEQTLIANLLTHAHRAMTVQENQIKNTLELKNITMLELFTKGLRNEGQKDTEFGLIPTSWSVNKIGNHYSVTSGGTPSRDNPEYWNKGTIPWVKSTDINYSNVLATTEYITESGIANSAAKLLDSGAVLMAMYGQGVTRGRVAILKIKAACNQACAAMYPLTKNIDQKFLFYFLTHHYENIRRFAHGGQQQNLNLEIIRNLPIAFPENLTEQLEIVSILEVIDKKIDIHKKKQVVLENLFKTLLHKLMTDMARVSELDLSALERSADIVGASA
jgi:type I restriction enzyme S subunit